MRVSKWKLSLAYARGSSKIPFYFISILATRCQQSKAKIKLRRRSVISHDVSLKMARSSIKENEAVVWALGTAFQIHLTSLTQRTKSVNLSRLSFSRKITLGILSTLVISPCVQAQARSGLKISANQTVSIVLPQQPIPSEETAAKELQNYLVQVTGAKLNIVRENQAITLKGSKIYVGPTNFSKSHLTDKSTFDDEEWTIQTVGNALILTGGRPRGTLYAAYHFLEDVVGVRWWNPWEETVPARTVLTVPQLNKRSKPAFTYRDIYALYGNDNGRFMARRRLDRQGNEPVEQKYGGSRNYGPPSENHTFFMILSPAKYFAEHPDWFISPGKEMPKTENSQLAISNPEMRKEFLKLLRDIIRKSNQDAKEKGVPAPKVFSVSENDGGTSITTPADAELLAKNDGAVSAVLLDFINYLADGTKDEFPDVFIDTLAYGAGEQAPKTIRPRDNVIIRLTDTTSNLILPITAKHNHVFHDNIIAWGKITKHLRVWDYAINFTYTGLPLPTSQTYQPDLQFWKAHNVQGIFVEHEYPIRADLRDFKIWMQSKLFEDPNLNYDALVREFTDGFYGPAGIFVRQYIYALQDEARQVGEKQGYENMTWTTPPRLFNFLSVDFVIRADAMFDEAARAAGSDESLQRRVRHARMPLDRYIARLYDQLTAQWKSEGHTEAMPLNLKTVVARYSKTWEEQIELRLQDPDEAATERKVAATEIKNVLEEPIYVHRATADEHAKFDDAMLANAIVFGPKDAFNYSAMAKVVQDKDAETGQADRLLLEDEPEEANRKKYKLPMPWGIYDASNEKDLLNNSITASQIPGPGFHWYKLGDIALPKNTYIYLFWSWMIQINLKMDKAGEKPGQIYEVWAQLKFEGPLFPYGKASERDAISVERVALIPHTAKF